MTDFDVIVIGGGTGNTVASAAASEGLETALVEKGPIGGTCLNRGCNPSKMLIHHANVHNQIRDAERFSIEATVENVRFGEFVREVNDTLAGLAANKTENKYAQDHLTLFETEAEFVDDHTVSIDGNEHTAERIVIATGSRPVVPGAIDGLSEIEYLTSTDAVQLETPPDRLVILGGGYIAAELGYYFDAFGTDVTIVEMLDSLVAREDSDVAEAFTRIAEERHTVHTGYRVTEVSESDGKITAVAESESGDVVEAVGDELLVALGRRPNSDTLGLDATDVALTDDGFVETDDRLRTSVEGIWAMGDVAGNAMFKHSGDYEGEIIVDNVVHGRERRADFTGLPHAIFTEPQVGAVGETEADLQESGTEYVVGRAAFVDTAMARALKLEEGFTKMLVAPDGEILGCHIVGHQASMLVHEVTPAIRNGRSVSELANTLIHAHPALSKVVMKACKDAVEQLNDR